MVDPQISTANTSTNAATNAAISNIVINILAQLGHAGPLILLVIIIIFSLYTNTPKSLNMSTQTYIIIILIWQIINIVSNTALKEIIKEPRPSNTQNVNTFDAINLGNDYGMPSGHAQLVFSQLSFIALTFKNNLLTFVAFIQSILTVIQRYQYRKHTAFQLFVGAIIGTLTGCMANHILISRKSMS